MSWDDPRPKSSSRRGKLGPQTKQQKYRQKLIAQGLCPHCGKPCSPYYECKKRRWEHGINRALRELIKDGLVGKDKDDKFYWIGGDVE